MQSPLRGEGRANQLGEDLMLQVKLTPGNDPKNLELRARESQDAVRGLYRYTIDLGGSGNVDRARSALGSIGSGDVTGCAAAFDSTLRRKLDPEQLARALSPRGDFTDPYVRAALRRLGEVSPGGMIHMEDGSVVPARRADRTRRGCDAGGIGQGFPRAAARLGARARAPEAYRSEALRSLVAPEMDRTSFTKALSAANAAGCGATTAGAEAGPG